MVCFFFFFKQKTAYEIMPSLVGSEMCIRDRHSTGQLHKGGPNTGLFLQLTDEPATDLAVPETTYTFGELIRAQAVGDAMALEQRGRRVLRIGLGRNAIAALRTLIEMV